MRHRWRVDVTAVVDLCRYLSPVGKCYWSRALTKSRLQVFHPSVGAEMHATGNFFTHCIESGRIQSCNPCVDAVRTDVEGFGQQPVKFSSRQLLQDAQRLLVGGHGCIEGCALAEHCIRKKLA